VSRLSVLKVN